MKELYPWQERIRKLLEPLLLRHDFLRAIEAYRTNGGSSDATVRLSLFGLPDDAINVVKHLAISGEIDYGLVPSPLEIINERDKTAEPDITYNESWWKRPNYTYIAVSHNARREDVEEFLRREWKNIEKKSWGHKYFLQRPTAPSRETFYAERDSAIYEAYIKGAKPKQLAIDTGLDDSAVRQILYRQKKKQASKGTIITEATKVGDEVLLVERYISTHDANEGEPNPEV